MSYNLTVWARGELDPAPLPANAAMVFGASAWDVRPRFYDASEQEIGVIDALAASPEDLSQTWAERGGRITAPISATTMRIELFDELNSGWVAGAIAQR